VSSGWQQFYYEARAGEWRERAKCNRIYMRLQFAYATVFLVSSAAFYMMFPRLWFLPPHSGLASARPQGLWDGG